MTAENSTVAEYAANKAWSGRGNLPELVEELERQKESRLDFCVDLRDLRVDVDGPAGEDRLHLAPRPHAAQARELLGADGLRLNDSALHQLGERCPVPVPWGFLRRLRDEQAFNAATLLTGEMSDAGAKRWLVRCLDQRVRAVLSDRYKVLDHYDLAFTALEVAKSVGAEVLECNLTPKHMRLKLVSREVRAKVDETREGDGWFARGLGSQDYLRKVAARSGGDLPGGPGVIHPVVTVTNSETGHGGMVVRMGVLRAVCFNLATVEDCVRKVHVGGRLESGIFTDETRAADGKAAFLQARDAIRATFDGEKFAALAADLNGAARTPIRAPDAAVGVVAERHDLTEQDRKAVFAHFMRDYAGENAYGLGQAVARHAQDVDADRAETLELAAGKILTEPTAYAVAA